jgi:protein SCO1/2
VRSLLPTVLCLLALGGGAGCAGGGDAPAGEGSGGIRGTVIDPPLEKPDFVMMDTEGKPFDFRTATRDRLTLLFFGYTNCPDVCPVTMANLGAVIGRYPSATRDRIRVVFVTTDPVRDTPQRMREWLDRFDADFVGLYGDVGIVDRVETALGLPVAQRPDSMAMGMDYPVGHSARVLVFTPDNNGRVTYGFGTRQEDWIHDLPLLLQQRNW